MPDNIREAVPKALKTLWELENELRGAAQNGVILRREAAKRHLAEARQRLDELLSLVRPHDGADESVSAGPADDGIPPPIQH